MALVHTSGSTGRPRAAKLSRRAFYASASASEKNLGWQQDDVWLLNLPLAHVGGLSVVTRCLAARKAVALPAEPGRWDPSQTLQTLKHQRVTLLSLVPTQLVQLLESPDRPRFTTRSKLRAVLVGGAKASDALLERARTAGWPVLATYGCTETCAQVATQRLADSVDRRAGVGPALPGVELRIEDGVIEVRSPTSFSGYVASSSSALSEDGWFRTGDLGRLDEGGNLHVLGRCDDVIVSGGENIHPAEVEDALLAEPNVTGACVVGVTDEQWGQRVGAVLELERRRETTPEQLRLPTLARFKRPRQLVVVEHLPRLPSGKLDRGACAALLSGESRAAP